MAEDRAARPILCHVEFYRYLELPDLQVWLPAVPRVGDKITFEAKGPRLGPDCLYFVRDVEVVAVVSSRPVVRPVLVRVSDRDGA